jgi:hypothetical protein
MYQRDIYITKKGRKNYDKHKKKIWHSHTPGSDSHIALGLHPAVCSAKYLEYRDKCCWNGNHPVLNNASAFPQFFLSEKNEKWLDFCDPFPNQYCSVFVVQSY